MNKEQLQEIQNLLERITLLEAQVQAQTQERAPAPKQKEPKLGNPDKYNGMRSLCRSFLAQCHNVFAMQPSIYHNSATGQRNSIAMIGYVASHLTDAPAAWYASLVATNSPLLQSWTLFSAEFLLLYDDPERERTAAFHLERLTQGKSTVAEYAASFRQYALDVQWGQPVLAQRFKRGLRDDIQDLLLTVPELYTLPEVINAAIKCEIRINERNLNKTNPLNSNSSFDTHSHHTGPTAMDLNAIDVRGKLTDAIRAECLRRGLCLYCRQPGHRVADCPTKPKESVKNFNNNKPFKYVKRVFSDCADGGAGDANLAGKAGFRNCNAASAGSLHHSVQGKPSDNMPIHLIDSTVRGTLHTHSKSTSVPILLDSGADISFIDRQYCNTHNITTTQLSKPITAVAVDGRIISGSWRAAHITFSIGEFKQTHRFVVTSCPRHPIILGRDWLSEINPQIDWAKSTCTINPTHVSLNATDTTTIPNHYANFESVFNKQYADTLPEHRPYDCAIDLIENAKIPFGPIYKLSPTEQKVLKEWLDNMLKKGFIQPSKSPAASPVLFAPKKDGTLRPCVDYRRINEQTIRNAYPLPIASALIGMLSNATWFTKFDLYNGYNLVRVRKGDEWKTAFRTIYGLYESLVMNFGLTNAPPAFQHFMNDIFHDIIDVYVVVYLDDILVFTTGDLELHHQHVSEVLKRLQDNKLYAKIEKCVFDTQTVDFLGYVISPDGISMDSNKVKAITDWPAPTTQRQVQSFLGFCNFYRDFIPYYSHVAMPLIALTHHASTWQWNETENDAFLALKLAFTKGNILRHYDPSLPTFIEADASDHAIGLVISQYTNNVLRPVAFHAYKFSKEQLHWDVYNKELFAIIEAFRKWRHFLEGASHPITVYSDHRNLTHWQTTRNLNRRQARWQQICASINFSIIHRPGKLATKPDALSRRADFVQGNHFISNAMLPANCFVSDKPELTLAPIDTIPPPLSLTSISNAQKTDPDVLDILNTTPLSPSYSITNDILYYHNSVVLPASFRLTTLENRHCNALAGHMGKKKTLELVSRDFWWPTINGDIANFVRECELCARCKTTKHKPFGKLKPIAVPDTPWRMVGMDFITDLPVSKGFDSILTVVDYTTRMAHFIPCNKTIDAPTLATLFIRNVIRLHGVPTDVISDRGPQFTSEFWGAVCKSIGTKTNFSTSFHPQSNGLAERMNQVLISYLRAFCNYEQDNWFDMLPMGEFSHNNSTSASTDASPFYLNSGYNPRMDDFTPTAVPSATFRLEELQDARIEASTMLANAQQRYKANADTSRGTDLPFSVGDKVWLNRDNIRSLRQKNKLDHRRIGPFSITEEIGNNAYKLSLPTSMRIHNVFHASLLEPYIQPTHPSATMNPPPLPIPTPNDVLAIPTINHILDSKLENGNIVYLVCWKNTDTSDNTWVSSIDTRLTPFCVLNFHKAFPTKPYRSFILEFCQLTLLQLHKRCNDLNIKVQGNKTELIHRIVAKLGL
jgi:hypothetical protein